MPIVLQSGSTLCGVQHVQHEADALAESNETDAHGQDDRQQANDLVENAFEHIGINDGGQAGCSRSSFALKSFLLSQEIYGSGSQIRTVISGFKDRRAAITPTRDISQKNIRRNLYAK